MPGRPLLFKVGVYKVRADEQIFFGIRNSLLNSHIYRIDVFGVRNSLLIFHIFVTDVYRYPQFSVEFSRL